jgi:hypothetical protein
MMKGQGEGAAQELNALPGEASFAAQLEMRQMLAQAKEQESDFSQEILGILKGVPSARVELQQQRQETAMARQEMRMKQLESDRDFWLDRQALALQQGKMKIAQDAEKRAAQAADRLNYESSGRDFEGNPMPGYVVNPKTGTLIPPGYHVDKQGNVVRKPAPEKPEKGKPKKPKFTATQRRSMIEAIDSKEDDIKALVIHAIEQGQWVPTAGKQGQRNRLGNEIFQHYVHLAGTPTARKRLRTLINKLLTQAGKIGPAAPGKGGGGGGSDQPSWVTDDGDGGYG